MCSREFQEYINLVLEHQFVKPYEVKRRKGAFWFGNWTIHFEDTELLCGLDRNETNTICEWLNGAYNLGRQSILIRLMLQNERQKTGA